MKAKENWNDICVKNAIEIIQIKTKAEFSYMNVHDYM